VINILKEKKNVKINPRFRYIYNRQRCGNFKSKESLKLIGTTMKEGRTRKKAMSHPRDREATNPSVSAPP
jgi:hypothetical protein